MDNQKNKLSMDNLEKVAGRNPFLDMRRVKKWLDQKAELERLGIDLSQPSEQPKREDNARHAEQRISLKYL